MNKQQLSNFLMHGSSMDDLGDIRSLIAEHPYFEIAHYILAKQMQQKDPLTSSGSLRKAAINATDRKKLFHFMRQDTADVGNELRVNKCQNSSRGINNAEKEAEDNEVSKEVENELINIQTSSGVNQKSAMDEKKALGSRRNLHLAAEMKEASESESNELGNLILMHSTEEMLAKELNEEEPSLDKGETPVNTDKEVEQDSFIGWLGKMKPVEGSETLKLSSAGDEVSAETKKSDDERELTFNEINKLAEKSILKNEELISETLADIYVNQKKYTKAMETLSLLSLKYPEKSTYFASRIEEIKKLQ